MTLSVGSPWGSAPGRRTPAAGAGLLARVPSLDLLRGIAILGVVLNHTGQGFSSGQGWLQGMANFGTHGVQLFFLVSAFTMCHLWSLRHAEPDPVRRFYLRRVARIAPLFWLAIPAYLLLFGLGARYQAPQGVQWHQVLTTLSFTHGFWPDTMNSVVPGSWSIAVEMCFYAVFPWLAMRLHHRRAGYLALAIGLWMLNTLVLRGWLEAFLRVHFVSPNPQLLGDFLYLNALNQAPVFLLGCYLYHAIARAPTRWEWLALGLWLAMAWLAKRELGIEGFGFLLICAALALVAALALRHQLRFPLLEHLGRHSYAIYLTHFMVLHALSHTVAPRVGLQGFVALLALTLATSYGLARLAHAWVERPVQDWVNARLAAGAPAAG